MRVELPFVPQPSVESAKTIEIKEVTEEITNGKNEAEESQSSLPVSFGYGKTYSVSSLRAAVDYHAKLLTVAESNLQAAQHPPKIPRVILDHFKAQ
jgi:hypothetical protein